MEEQEACFVSRCAKDSQGLIEEAAPMPTKRQVGTALLRAYEADAAHSADTPAQPYVIYRALSFRDGLKHEPDDVIDLNTGERVGLPAAEVPCALPAPTPSAAPTEILQPREEIELEILDD